MRRSDMFQFVFTVCAVFVYLPFAASAATYVVDSDTDAVDASIGDGVCASSGGDCTLRAAIQESNSDAGPEDNSADDVITLPAGTYELTVTGNGEEFAATGDLDITDTSGSLTINGAGSDTTTIDGNSDTNSTDDRVLDVKTSTTVVINDVTVTDGSVTNATGGGIRNYGSLTMEDVIVTANSGDTDDLFATGNGAGMYCDGGSVDLTNITVSDNTATSSDGSFNGGGASLTLNCDITIDTATFSGNATEDAGGGLILGTDENTVTVTDITISENSAGYAGGLYIIGSDTESNYLTINRMTVNDNTSGGLAGGIALVGPAYITNATIIGNAADTHGGGIMVANSAYADAVLAHVSIFQNYADADDSGSGDGGGIYIYGSGPDIYMNGSLLAANYVGDPDDASADTDDDCYEEGGFEELTDSLLDTTTGCEGINTETRVTNNGGSPYATTILSDSGGEVQIAAAGAFGVTLDAVSEENCDDAQGNPLTVDARGYTRPENENCDMGAVEIDQTDPVISVNSGTDTIECSVDTWTDAGATISDNFDETVSGSATASGSVTEETVGSYTITYSSSERDYDSNSASNQTRTVTVQDTTAPTITVTGESSQTLTVGDSYTDAGATASDTCDESVSVSSSGSVDTSTAGTYTITYSASDDSENSATQKTRTVTVEEAAESEEDNEESTDESNDAPSDDETEEIVRTRSNGKYVRVFVNGTKVTQKRIAKKTVKKKFRRIMLGKLYKKKAYRTVAFVSVFKTRARLTVFRLTQNNTLKKKHVQQFPIFARAKPRITFQAKKKRIIVRVGNKTNVVKKVLRLTKKGRLQQL